MGLGTYMLQRYVKIALLAIVISLGGGCYSLIFHFKEATGDIRPTVFPGIKAYFLGNELGFWEITKRTFRTDPLPVILVPAFMAIDAISDTVLLPIDAIMVTTCQNEYVSLKDDGKRLELSTKRVFEKEAEKLSVLLDMNVIDGSIVIEAHDWPESVYEMYIPSKKKVFRVIGELGGNECSESSAELARRYVGMRLYPPTIGRGSGRWSFSLIDDEGQSTGRMTLGQMFLSDDFKGRVSIREELDRH